MPYVLEGVACNGQYNEIVRIFCYHPCYGSALMNPNAQGSMMGPYPNQPVHNPASINMAMMPGLHMPGTYNMGSMMNEIYPELLKAWPHASMWQGKDGAIRIQPEPQGPVYSYFVPMEGWNSSQGSGTYMHFDNGGFQAVTSNGTYQGHPATYESVGFTDMTQSIMGSPVDITYGSDAAITFELPAGNQWVCLEVSAQAARLIAGRMVLRTLSKVMEFMGSYGYSFEYQIEKYFREVKIVTQGLGGPKGTRSIRFALTTPLIGDDAQHRGFDPRRRYWRVCY
jgi:hypothetical protein